MQTRKGKWQAFEALSTLKGSLNEVRTDHHKIEKPILSEDKWVEIEEECKLALEETREIILSYYIRGEIQTISGIIEKVDLIYKTIQVQGIKIRLHDLLDAKVKPLLRR